MRVILGGVRGSSPRSQRGFVRFGGATSCVLVEQGPATRIVIDAGTGLGRLRHTLENSAAGHPVLMLFTHYHLDHVIGLPPFAPLYRPEWPIVFAAPEREGVTSEQALRRLTAAPFWPAAFRARQCHVVLPDVPGRAAFRHGPLRVRWCAVRHRNGCHAYRIDAPRSGESMALVTDLEWATSDASERAALLRLCGKPHPVDLLVMEGHGERSRFPGWGHSTWRETVEVARAANVRNLVITHHAPDDDDRRLARRAREVRAAMPGARLGREGMTLSWGPGTPLTLTQSRA
ncbi:MAG: MBL fold metallo-hydrolase [Kiritimatiellia bacterium]|nr:MBL fold metallo-hydrolase [Kiritimatiellia bacterium]